MFQRRIEQSPQRNNGHAGRAGKCGKQRTGHQRDHRKAARHPAEHRFRQVHKPTRRTAFAEQVAGKREHRYRHQEWQVGQTENTYGHDRKRIALLVKTVQCTCADNSKQWRTEQRQQYQQGSGDNHCAEPPPKSASTSRIINTK